MKKREKRREKEREREREGDDIQRTATTGKKFESLHSFITQGLFLTAWTSLSLSLSLSLSHFSPWFSVYFIWLLQPYTNRLLGVILRRCFLVSLTTFKKKTFFCQQVLVDASLTSGATTFGMTTLSVMTLSMTEKMKHNAEWHI